MKKTQKILTTATAALIACIMAVPASLTPAFAVKAQPSATVQAILKTKKISACKITFPSSVGYTGKALKPAIKVTDGKKVLKEKLHYTVKYSSNTAFGKGKITISGNKLLGYQGTKTVEFKIVPKTVTPKASVTANSVTLAWSKVPGSTKYEIYKYDTKKKTYAKVKTVTGTSYKESKLKQGTTHKYKVRAVAVVKGKTYNGGFGAVTATTKTAAQNTDIKNAVSLFNSTINAIKNSKDSFNIKVTEVVSFKVEEASTLKEMINSLLKSLAKPSETNYKVTKGKVKDTNNGYTISSLNKVIPPYERKASLKEEYVKSASIKKSGNNNTYTIILKSENSTFDGKTYVAPKGNESCTNVLNLVNLNFGEAKITKSKVVYSGTKLEFTLNNKNKITSYKITAPLKADITGKIEKTEMNITISGTGETTYTFKY